MTGRVRSRLNHYEVLGVSPTAAGDELADAFARLGNVFRPHAFGGLAELCIAYETLRDPIRRRAYDAAIGLERKPNLPNLVAGARQALIAQGPVTAGAAMAQPLAPPAETPPRSEPLTKPALPLGPGADSQARREPRIGRGDAPRLALEEELGIETSPIDLKRTLTILGTVVVATCLLGGLAGWWSASGVGETAQPENTVSVTLPPAKPLAAPYAQETALALVPSVPKAQIASPKPAVAASTSPDRNPIVSEHAAVAEQLQEGDADPSLGGQTVEQAPTTSSAAAAMPLADRVIARTIQRIGYSCGSVASTVPVESEAPGVYKVICSSGQSYQARPVNGRYHFRRWGKR